jgi:transaldolase
VDRNKAIELCLEIQRYYSRHKASTLVLPASLTSTSEIMALAGVNHITIAPLLLEEIARTPVSTDISASVLDQRPGPEDQALPCFKDDELEFRQAFAERNNGEGERKLNQVRKHGVIQPENREMD